MKSLLKLLNRVLPVVLGGALVIVATIFAGISSIFGGGR